jgi:hypothetical protein
MPQWDRPYYPPYSIYQCERPHDQAEGLTQCILREPLKTPDHIRLLKLYPPGWPNRLADKLTRDEDGEIRCDVFQVALASVITPKRPYFATLSYVWGDSNDTRMIKCGRNLVPVTRNLHEALVHIRNLTTPRLLWVDSLCINQADKREKGQQVQRMHFVYGQSHCISWMGVESKDHDDLQSILPAMRRLSEAENHLAQRRIPLGWNAVSDYLHHKSICGLSDLRLFPWATILHCLNRDIFARLWCVQEIILARSNDIRTSRAHIDVGVLASCAHLILRVLNDLFSTGDTSEVLDCIRIPWRDMDQLHLVSDRIDVMLMAGPIPCIKFKREGRPITHVTALSIIDHHSEKECSDPRDHVYGLAALCSLGTSYRIDYSALSLATQEVFANFTLHCIRTTKSLQAFELGYRRTTHRENSNLIPHPSWRHRLWTPGLPSWCPDFAGPKPSIRIISATDDKRNIPLRASNGRPAQLTRLSRRRLGVIGIEIGTIQVCTTTWKRYDEHDPASTSCSTIWQYLASLQTCMNSIESSISAQLRCRLLLDVLSMGQDWKHCPAGKTLAEALPAQTKDRMIYSSLGAAWLIQHVPTIASKAKLTLHRWLDPKDWTDIANQVQDWLYLVNQGTRLFTTDNFGGLIGTGPEGLQTGDVVCVLYGGDLPFILRPDNQGQYLLIGGCYVSGTMHGEALDMGLKEREFLIV